MIPLHNVLQFKFNVPILLFIYFNDGGGHGERKGVKSEIIKTRRKTKIIYSCVDASLIL